MNENTGQHLQNLVDKGDLDRMLADVLATQSTANSASSERSQFERTRHASLCSEALDYGGRYGEAEQVIRPFLDEATNAIAGFLKMPLDAISAPASEGIYQDAITSSDAALYHQFCYVLINGGMCIYRHANYDRKEFERAYVLFEIAEDALALLEKMGRPHRGARARAWYCKGLIHRELYKYGEARTAFAKAIEIGAEALKDGNDQQQPRYEYAMSKCYGLGNAWISYTEASLAEAKSHIVAARILLKRVTATYIAAYIDLVNATILLSSGSTLSVINEAMKLLHNAYTTLGGDTALNAIGVGHGPYAMRLANELASAHLKYGQTCAGKDEREQHLNAALEIVARVRASVHAKLDSRSACKSHILESRVHREFADYDAALRSAKAAFETGGEQEFSRVDCWLTLGEAKFCTEDYSGAQQAFEQALEFGATNRKIFAACHLHLSRTYLHSKQFSKARYHFKIWESTGRALENAFIRSLKAEVERSINEIEKDFIRTSQEADLNAENHINALRRWLVKVALSRTGNDNPKAAAVLLDVSESTVANWLRLDADGNIASGTRRRKRSGRSS